MKKILTILSSLAVASSGTASFETLQKINNDKTIINKMNSLNTTEDSNLFSGSNQTPDWVEENVTGFEHEKITSATGKSEKSDTKTYTYVKSTPQKDHLHLFDNSQYVRVHGYFSFHTYKEPRYENALLLKLDKTQIVSSFGILIIRIYRSSGWASQTSRIKLTLTGSYNPEQEKTTFVLNSYVYARTAWSVHSASTLSWVNRIQMMQGQA